MKIPEPQLFPAAWFFATTLKSKSPLWEYSAISVCSINQLKKEVENVCEALNIFDWNKTLQGYDFWLDIYTKVHNDTMLWNPQIKTPIVYTQHPNTCLPYDPEIGKDTVVLPRDLKRIIGYKAPYNLFGGRIKKGELFCRLSPKGLVMYVEEHGTTGVATEIVKTWEPVYAPDVVILNLGRPEVIVTISATARIEAKGQLVGWGIIEQIKKEMSMGDKQVASWPVSYPEVVIGCSRFSREDINKIWKAFTELNTNLNRKP